MDTMTFSGGGSERDNALQGGCRQNARSFISGVDRERATFPLGLSQAIQHRDLVGGDLVSLKEGKIVPLDRSLPFSGIIESVSEDRGRYIGSVTTRGAIVVRVEGLSPETRSGSRVYALPGIRTVFTLETTVWRSVKCWQSKVWSARGRSWGCVCRQIHEDLR